jgi:hypothetical protein
VHPLFRGKGVICVPLSAMGEIRRGELCEQCESEKLPRTQFVTADTAVAHGGVHPAYWPPLFGGCTLSSAPPLVPIPFAQRVHYYLTAQDVRRSCAFVSTAVAEED